jgi:polysaccharide export outer membrane protein
MDALDQLAAEAATHGGGNYVIGPGITLEVFVWHHPELCMTVPVHPDGKISTPLVEDMVAVGKTPPQLARDMEKALSGYYVDAPKVSIIITIAGNGVKQAEPAAQAR